MSSLALYVCLGDHGQDTFERQDCDLQIAGLYHSSESAMAAITREGDDGRVWWQAHGNGIDVWDGWDSAGGHWVVRPVVAAEPPTYS